MTRSIPRFMYNAGESSGSVLGSTAIAGQQTPLRPSPPQPKRSLTRRRLFYCIGGRCVNEPFRDRPFVLSRQERLRSWPLFLAGSRRSTRSGNAGTCGVGTQPLAQCPLVADIVIASVLAVAGLAMTLLSPATVGATLAVAAVLALVLDLEHCPTGLPRLGGNSVCQISRHRAQAGG